MIVMETRKTLYLVVVLCFTALIQPASSSTIDQLFNYSIIGSLQEKVNVERLEVVDVDNSGIADILVVTTGTAGTPNTRLKNTVYVFNSNGSVRWRYSIDREIYASLIYDMDNDKKIETVVSSGQMQDNIARGTIRIIDDDGSLIRQFSRTSLVKVMYIDDIDKDRYYELLTGSSGRFTLLYVDGEKIWDYPEDGTLNASVYSISTIDLDGDGRMEVMYGSGGVYLLSSNGGFIAGYEVESDVDVLKREVNYLSDARLVSGGYPEILSVEDNKNKVYALGISRLTIGGTTYTADLERMWTYRFYNKINSIKLYDIDEDNLDELLIASEDGNVYALDNTGALLWSFRLDGAGKDAVLADVDGDGEADVIVASSSGSVYKLDAKGNFLWKHDTNLELEKLSVGDIDGDELMEVVVTTSEPKLYGFKLNRTFIQKTKADNLYAQGERYFIASSYLQARETLIEAREIYRGIGLESDVNKVQSLIDRIDYQMSEERRQLADLYYEKAQEYYISGDYPQARKYAAMAKGIYREFGDSESILKCELLELRIDTVTHQTTLPVTTTKPSSQGDNGDAGFDFNPLILFGIILVIAVVIVTYIRKRSSEKQVKTRKEPWEDEVISSIDKMDLDIGDEDEI